MLSSKQFSIVSIRKSTENDRKPCNQKHFALEMSVKYKKGNNQNNQSKIVLGNFYRRNSLRQNKKKTHSVVFVTCSSVRDIIWNEDGDFWRQSLSLKLNLHISIHLVCAFLSLFKCYNKSARSKKKKFLFKVKSNYAFRSCLTLQAKHRNNIVKIKVPIIWFLTKVFVSYKAKDLKNIFNVW